MKNKVIDVCHGIEWTKGSIANISWKIKSCTQKSPALLAIIINALFLAFILFFCSVSFETNDDSAMALIAYGASTGAYSVHLVFINCLVGLLLKLLLSIVPFVPWYSVVMLLVLFCSYCAISYCFIKKDSLWGVFLSFLVLLFFGYYMYTSLQFTETAAVSTIAGILLMFMALGENDIKKHLILAALVLLIFGACYRFNMFCCIFIVMSGYGLYQVANHYKSKNLNWIIRCTFIFGIAIVLCFCFRFFDRFEYNRNNSYSEYQTFNSYRSELMDHGFPDYADNSEVYQSLNISEDDLQLFKSWNFADPDIFTTEALAVLVELKEQNKTTINLKFIKEFFSWFPVTLLKYNWLSAVFIVFIISLLWNRKNIIWIIYGILTLIGLQFYFFYIERYLQARVDIGIFFAVSVFWGMVMLDDVPKQQKFIPIVLTSVVSVTLTLVPGWYQSNQTDATEAVTKAEAIELSSLISEDTGNLYLCTIGSSPYSEAYGVWDVVPAGSQTNIYSLGGWKTNFPATDFVLDSYQVKNPFQDVVNSPYIYLIDNHYINAVVSYICRHYDENVYARLIKQINGTSIWKITSEALYIDASNSIPVPDNLMQSFDVVLYDSQLFVNGYAYIDGLSSYQGNVYVLTVDSYGNQTYYQMTQYENAELEGDIHGQFSAFSLSQTISGNAPYRVQIFYENAGSLYCVWEHGCMGI